MQCRNSLMLSELECSRVISGPYPIWLGDFVSLSLLAAIPLLFYLFLVIETKVLPYLLPNATSTVAYKEKTIFPIKICPTVHIVMMFSAWDGKMLKILTQHEHVPSPASVLTARPGSSPVSSLGSHIWSYYQFLSECPREWDSSAFLSWPGITWFWGSCEKTW